MIILPERDAPVGKFLMPQKRREWMASSQRPSFDPFEHGQLTRWKVVARLHDGHKAWTGWFDDREDVDAFLWALANGTLPYERELWGLSTPAWHPEIAPNAVYAVVTLTFLTTTGANTYTTPIDWNSTNNTIGTLGGGVNGAGASNPNGGNGGAGAAYSTISNLMISGSVNYTVGAAAGDTWFNGTTLALSSCGAKGGSGSTGGASASGVGTTKFSGGNGSSQNSTAGGGGGGAAGKNGAGNNSPANGGVNASPGASGDAGFGGAAGAGGFFNSTSPTVGGNGTEWDASHGSGGGGGGGARVSPGNGQSGQNGGNYGAGAGGGGWGDTGGSGGSGIQGIIAISYTPRLATSFNMPNSGL